MKRFGYSALTLALLGGITGCCVHRRVDGVEKFSRTYVLTHPECVLDSHRNVGEPGVPEVGFSMYRCGESRTIINVSDVNGKPWRRP